MTSFSWPSALCEPATANTEPLWFHWIWATIIPVSIRMGSEKKIKHMLIQLSFFAIRILSKHVHVDVNQLSRLNPGNYVIFATSIFFLFQLMIGMKYLYINSFKLKIKLKNSLVSKLCKNIWYFCRTNKMGILIIYLLKFIFLYGKIIIVLMTKINY